MQHHLRRKCRNLCGIDSASVRALLVWHQHFCLGFVAVEREYAAVGHLLYQSSYDASAYIAGRTGYQYVWITIH